MSEIDPRDLLFTLEVCRKTLPPQLLPEHEARLQQIEALIKAALPDKIDAAMQEHILLTAADDLFDDITAYRMEQWAVQQRTLYTYPHGNSAHSQPTENEKVDEEDETSDEKDQAPDITDLSREIRLLNYLFSPYTTPQQHTWQERYHTIQQMTHQVIEVIPDPALQAAFRGDQDGGLDTDLKARQENDDNCPFDIPIDLFDPDHVIALTRWLFNPHLKRQLAAKAWSYRTAVQRLRQIIAAISPTVQSAAIDAARVFLTTLCSNCGHPRPLTTHFGMCASCAYAHPIGGPFSTLSKQAA